MSQSRCADCAYWVAPDMEGYAIAVDSPLYRGECHRYPPVNDWVQTYPDSWCGEFKLKTD